MSSRDVIKSHEGRRLFQHTSHFYGEETCRYVYVSECVWDFIHRQVDDHIGHVGRNVRGLLDYFIEGDPITVGWNPHEKGACLMARVDSHDPGYEVWDVRALDPYPGARVFGAFAEFNVFVALTWCEKEDGLDYVLEAESCIQKWKELFDLTRPHRGRFVGEYFKKPHEVV